MNIKEIYFDNSATTKVDDQVIEAMLPFMQETYGNANALHSFGQIALEAVEESREKISKFFNCDNQEIIFTSGATESNNIAIQGVANELLKKDKDIHIITSRIEHPAVLEVVKKLGKNKKVSFDLVDVDKDGIVRLDKLKSLIKDNTVMVSIMYANNEVGTIQPIKEISEMLKESLAGRSNKDFPLLLHVDAVQAINYLDCNVVELGIDLLSFSGHKIYGPKGIGGLYVKGGIKINNIIQGGHQEFNIRPGTLNVPGIVGLGKAIELIAQNRNKDFQKIKKIKDKLTAEIEKIEDTRFNGDYERQLPNILNISFKKAEGESLLMMLDMAGISISTGSACSSGSLEPSHVLTAMGVSPEWAHGSLRISLGRFNSESEIPSFVASLIATVEKLRKMAP